MNMMNMNVANVNNPPPRLLYFVATKARVNLVLVKIKEMGAKSTLDSPCSDSLKILRLGLIFR